MKKNAEECDIKKELAERILDIKDIEPEYEVFRRYGRLRSYHSEV